jgi:enoyl-CoA hydratase/carnithine racemase
MNASDNGRGSDSWARSWSHVRVDRRSPGHCRVTFDHPPINTITATTVTELAELVDLIEQDEDLNVVVFDSANPEFFLAHYDTEGDPGRTLSMPPGPTGMHPWLDLTARLSRAPVVSIASVQGRARGAGSEFVLACDIRLAGEKAILAQFEVGAGIVPGGGPMARLPRLIGRGRALEVLLVADDIDAALAERYGYVNRVVPGERLADETDRMARRLASFDKQAIAETKAFVDATTLPDDDELPAALAAFFRSSGRPAAQERLAVLVAEGYGRDGELERRLGELVTIGGD